MYLKIDPKQKYEASWEIRFLKCSEAKKYPLVPYAKDEGSYYAVLWENWLTPKHFQEALR